MKRTWTILGVGNVAGSCKWYQVLFGQPATRRGQERLYCRVQILEG
jgi:hypothetical protein